MMKNYLVFSDIHGDYDSLVKMKKIASENDGAFFAGDGLSSLSNFATKEFYAVKGNCDLFGEEEKVVEINGVKILLTHGHNFGVKQSYLRLFMRAKELECSVVIFGHTHLATVFEKEGVLFVNPGTCSYHANQKTYAILIISKGKAQAYLNNIL